MELIETVLFGFFKTFALLAASLLFLWWFLASKGLPVGKGVGLLFRLWK